MTTLRKEERRAAKARDREIDRLHRRWIKGRYTSSADAAQALAWITDRLLGDAEMGIDYEAVAVAMLAATGRDHSYREHLMDLQGKLSDAIARALVQVYGRSEWRAVTGLQVWQDHRMRGLHMGKISRDRALDIDTVESTIYDLDRAFEDELAHKNMIGGDR